MCYDEMNVSIQKLQEIGSSTLSKMLKTLNAHNFLNILETYWNWGSKCSYWLKESNWRRIFAVPLNQFSQLLKMMKI